MRKLLHAGRPGSATNYARTDATNLIRIVQQAQPEEIFP